MANHKSAKKRIRQTLKRKFFNNYYSKTVRNAIRSFITIKEKDKASEQLPSMISSIDKLARRGVIHKNKAANLKSKLAKKVNAI